MVSAFLLIELEMDLFRRPPLGFDYLVPDAWGVLQGIVERELGISQRAPRSHLYEDGEILHQDVCPGNIIIPT